jgi:hypothetical protein
MVKAARTTFRLVSTKIPNNYHHLLNGVTVLYMERKDGSIIDVFIDTKDFAKVRRYRWHAQKHRNTFYAHTNCYKKSGVQSALSMHRLLNPNWKQIDHENRNGCNNRRSNLRRATGSQNQGNRQKTEGTSSQYRGVAWQKARKSWRVQIQRNGKINHLGVFLNEIDAARAYNVAALKYFGEFACINILPVAA